MDEPIEPQPNVPAEPAEHALLLPLPIAARSTEHPWEEPPLLPAPSMFIGSTPAPVRGRHARRSRPVALVSLAAAAAVLVGGSAVAMVSLASSGERHAVAGTSTGGPQAAGAQVAGDVAPSASAGPGAGADTGLVPARFAQTRRPAPTASTSEWLRATVATRLASRSPATGGSGSTAVQSARGSVVQSTGGSGPTATTGGGGAWTTGGGSTVVAGGGGGSGVTGTGPRTTTDPGTGSPVILPSGRPTIVPSRPPTLPGTVPSTDPTSAVPPPPHGHPSPHPSRSVPASPPSNRPPHPEPAPKPTKSDDPSPVVSAPAPEASDSEPAETDPPTGPVPSPSHTDAGLHRALGHLLYPPGAAVGHTKSPAHPAAEPTKEPDPSPTASLAE